MPPQEYKGNVRSMIYEIVVEQPEELGWLLASDEGGARFGRSGLDEEMKEEGAELRVELERRGAVVRQLSDTSLGWMGVLYDLAREDDSEEFPFRSILDEIDKRDSGE